MIDFYALTSPNVQKIFVMLEECGLPYNIKPVDVWAGEQFTPEFTKINPLLKVPAIVDSDGPGGKPYTVIESGAILIYLAEKTGRFIPHEPVARYDTLQWVILQVANVGPMAGQHVHGHGCAISNCLPSTLPNIQKSSPGRTRSHRATQSSGRSHRSAR